MDRIEKACVRAGRRVEEVKLIGATKQVSPEKIREAYEAGLKVFGENRIQEALKKMQELADLDIEWHFIGVLQSNKVKKAVENFQLIHSISSVKLAKKANDVAARAGKKLPVLFEINLGGEESKAGFSEEEFFASLDELSSLENLLPQGLMTIPPFLPPEQVRPYFSRLREILERVRKQGYFGDSFKELSMGMSNDFEVAVEEGATIVRIGTAIFGRRE